jgi:hypothetical protein
MAARGVLNRLSACSQVWNETGAADGMRGSRRRSLHLSTWVAKSPVSEENGGFCYAVWDQNEASSSSMISLSIASNTARVLVSSGRKFFAKNEATAILPS